ncbi:globin domain-containing protein [Deinococcus aquaedulcis]|uniref:globin domain-containing protein n=1 Tax=Deinococcus aquaedulcis TaxID=2840455 RepID=UPI001C83D569|nr:globin [Deinococcus aquaedulcis]
MTAPLSLHPGGSLYERIGPQALSALVTRFYGHVAAHPDLAPIFPADLTETAEKQLAFLTGFLGGPPLYHERYGHPRLRARHLPFPITPARARAWLACMNTALRETTDIGEAEARELYAALSRVAVHMVNTTGD